MGQFNIGWLGGAVRNID